MMNPPSYMPDYMADSDGFYSLDLSVKERIALTRVIDDYADVGTIKQDTFKELTLKFSKKNKLLLGSVGNPSGLNVDHNKIFDIQLLKADFSYPVQGLQITGISDVDEGGYLVTLFGQLNDWYRPMSQLRLNELDLGIITIGYNWYLLNNIPKYEDGNAPVFTSLVNYGKWFIEKNIAPFSARSQVVFNDLRLWYSPLAVLRAAFCQVGYEFIAPNLEEEEFRQQWCYLLDPAFETANQSDLPNRPFQVERLISGQMDLSVLFENKPNGKNFEGVLFWTSSDVVNNPGNHLLFNNDFLAPYPPDIRYFGCFYTGGVVGNFKYTGTSSLRLASGAWTTVAPDFVTITFTIKKSLRFGMENQADLFSYATTLASKTVILTGVFLGGTPVDTDFEIETGFIKVYQHEVVFVQMELKASLVNGMGGQINETAFYNLSVVLNPVFSMVEQQQIIEDGDNIDLGLMLRKDLSPVDLLKGVTHLQGLKIETDSINKRVFAFPEFKYNWYRSGLQEPFFNENTDDPFDATPKVQANSMEEELSPSKLARNVYLKFKDSTDGFISQLAETDQSLTTQELHSKKIDLGATFSNGEEIFENPFFEPTATGIDNQTSGLSVGIGPVNTLSSNLIPFLWDGVPSEDDTYPSKGFDFTPRILIAYEGFPLLEPSISGRDVDTTPSFIYQDSVSNIFYDLFGQIFPEGVKFTIVSPQLTPDMANVYGNGVNPNIKDQFTFFYSRMINQAYFGVVLNFLVKLDLLDFTNLSFRRKWKVRYLSEPWGEIFFYARLSRVDDYVIGENITTPVQLISDSNNTNLGC